MDFKNLNKAIVSMKYNNKPKTKEPREERTRSQEKIIHELAKFKKGVEEKKGHSEMKTAQKERKGEWALKKTQ